ncbi:hypothetical protein OK349_10775 [Sphingomonas sp. BT-65]|uniref:hypothetical protein n=1 Tax=Sphingomonas sp. BT-65 TaxID=2989821 RepID=UPI002235EF93|nr:hypothetical protein [Sphingomonas sp. BT-65]MCW4462190.1 hypothetical protein [Sphingomonas sp. BT-65]
MPAATQPADGLDTPFDPVPTRPRHDGWTPEKQTGFIDALAESGCVTEAAARVGMSATTAYTLRRRPDAQSFRMAWEAALDHAVQRLSDAAFARALNGVSRPVFFQGEQVGERRYYDERLTMFLLRYRDPVRYGAWLDDMIAERHPDGAALALARWTDRVGDDAWADALGGPRSPQAAPLLRRRPSPDEAEAEREAREEGRIHAIRQNEFNAWLRDDLIPPKDRESGGM